MAKLIDYFKNTNNNLNIKRIVTLIIVLVIISVILYYVFKKDKLAGRNNATQTIAIPAKKLVNKNNTNNYTYSMWVYVDNWNYRYGEEKVILERIDDLGNPTPSVKLGSLDNNMTISVSCYPSSNSSSSNPIVKDCVVRNIPIQKWTNIIISVYGRTLDVYLDGKLVRTCVLPGVPKMNQKSDVKITPYGGFSGYTSEILFLNKASNPKQAYDIYRQGNGSGSLFNAFFNKYKVKFSIIKDNNVESSLEI